MSMQEYRDPSCSVFVGNLETSEQEASVMEEILWELFIQAGPLKSIHLPKDKESGIPKKFAFVEYEHEISVAYACDLFRGIQLFGRSINVKPSTQGNDSSSSRNATSPGQSQRHHSSQSYSFETAPTVYDQHHKFAQQPNNQTYMFGNSNSSNVSFNPHGNWNQQNFHTPQSRTFQGHWGNPPSPVYFQAMMNMMNSGGRQGRHNMNQTPSRSSQQYHRQNYY